MISKNTLRSLVSRALATTVRRTSKRRKSRNSGTEQLETRALLAVFTVTSTGDGNQTPGSLREIINQANSTPGADEIVFSPATIGSEINVFFGELTITETVTITGNGSGRTIINAAQANRIFVVTAGDFTVNGLTLKGGRSTANGTTGGAISSVSGAINVVDSILTGNYTSGQEAHGGAISSNSGAVTITRSTLSGNSTEGSQARGGAIYTNSGSVTVSESTLSGNSTTEISAFGGAIFSTNGAITLSQSTLSGNSTLRGSGGAVFSLYGSVLVRQSTLTGNTATKGGAIYGHQSEIVLRNSIVAGNATTEGGTDILTQGSTTLSVINSLIGRNDGTFLAATVGTTPGANGNLIGGSTDGTKIDPLLLPLRNNGGPTQTHALLSTSPAIDRGSDSLANDFFNDQRGNPFLRISGVKVDMGAYERQTVASLSLIVDTNQDENDGIYSAGDLSLREAIGLANGSIGTNTITFATSLFTGGSASIVLRLGELGITESVTINSPGQTLLSINANQLSRVLNVIGGSQINVTLTGLTLTGGRTTGNNAFLETTHSGGGIRFDSTGTLTLTNSTVSGNTTTGSNARGGGIFGYSGAVMLTNSTVSGNTTTGSNARGGGIYAASGVVTLTNSTVSGNSTTGSVADGGGIFAGSGVVTLTNSTVSGNSTGGSEADGGGIFAISGAVTLTNSTVSGNSSTGSGAHGGGIYAFAGAVTLTNSTVSGNHVTGTDSDGGGVRFDDSVVTIVNSTITGNSATRAGGGLGMLADGPDKKLTIHNSIIAGNTAGSNPDFTAPTNPGTNLEVRFSLIGRSDGTTLTASVNPDASGNLIGGTTDPAKINPLLEPLANNGGPTLTHALQTLSPAFNRGSNALAVNVSNGNFPLTTDQRGTGSVRIAFGTVDMGAVEARTLDGTTGADAFTLTYSSTATSGTVTVTVSTNGGPVVNRGTFPMNVPFRLNGLGGTDSVRVVGTTSSDTFSVASTSLTVNGSTLILTSIETRTLAGATGSDVYRFDADAALGLYTLTESGVGTDTIDLSHTTTVGLSLNLGIASTQVVHPTNLSLNLSSSGTFENIAGGSLNDTLAGNALANLLNGNAGSDTLNGAGGSDTLLGGLGDDTYVFSPATAAEADTLTEGAGGGVDTISFATITTPVTFSLGTGAVQPVHTNRTLRLNSTIQFENAAGGSGADTLNGNTVANILIGNAGGDTLNGLGGRDILIGGLGLDRLNGGDDEDILIAGRTASDALFSSLNRMQLEWTSGNSYATRITNLRAGVGSPAVSLKAKVNVRNDAGEDDSLIGGNNPDWYFRALDDVITGLVAGEVLDVL